MPDRELMITVAQYVLIVLIFFRGAVLIWNDIEKKDTMTPKELRLELIGDVLATLVVSLFFAFAFGWIR